MNRRATLAAISASLMLAGLAAPAGDAAAQDAKSLVGTYTLVSADTIDASGKKTPTFGPNARGSLIFTSNGRYSIQFASGSLPKFASNNRTKGTPEENQVPETLDNRGADALDGERTWKISGMVR